MATSILALLLAAAAAGSDFCPGYLGKTVDPVPISRVFEALPEFAPRDPYESTASYEQRLQAGAESAGMGMVVIDRPWGDRPPGYDPDKLELTVYDSNFGYGQLDFQRILRIPIQEIPSSFGGIGFWVTRKITSTSSHEATNGFGARFEIEHKDEAVDAIWERPLKIGESPFVRGKRDTPLKLSLPPAQARDIIESGRTAFVATPVPPFYHEGTAGTTAGFSSPRSTTKNVRVLRADIHCALVLDGSRMVIAALTIK